MNSVRIYRAHFNTIGICGGGIRNQYTNIVHRGYFAGSSVVWQPSIGVWNLSNDLCAVIHVENISFVVEPVRAFLDMHTSIRANSGSSDAGKLVHIEVYGVLCNLVGFVQDETTTGEFKQVGIIVPNMCTCKGSVNGLASSLSR